MTIENTGTTESSSGSEGMTAAETAYFQSGGKDTAALEQEWGQTSDSEGVTGESNSQQSQQGHDQSTAGGDPDAEHDPDLEDGEMLVTVGPDGKARNGKGQFVPHKAFHAVREKYKATRDENQQLRDAKARAEERIAVFTDLVAKAVGGDPAPVEGADQIDEAAPDPEKDIFGYVKWQAKQVELLKAQLAAKTGSDDARNAEQQFRTTYISDATQFLAKTPDFRDAYSHLVQGRDRELAAIGMTDPAERKAYIAKEEKAIVQAALQAKKSPSETLYGLAKARGYAGTAPKPAQQHNDQQARIQQIANGQKAAGNHLSNAGGSSGEGLTAEAFLNMTDEQYAEAVSKLSPAQRRTLLGG